MFSALWPVTLKSRSLNHPRLSFLHLQWTLLIRSACQTTWLTRRPLCLPPLDPFCHGPHRKSLLLPHSLHREACLRCSLRGCSLNYLVLYSIHGIKRKSELGCYFQCPRRLWEKQTQKLRKDKKNKKSLMFSSLSEYLSNYLREKKNLSFE